MVLSSCERHHEEVIAKENAPRLAREFNPKRTMKIFLRSSLYIKEGMSSFNIHLKRQLSTIERRHRTLAHPGHELRFAEDVEEVDDDEDQTGVDFFSNEATPSTSAYSFLRVRGRQGGGL